jgi:hypothetical protein
MKEQIMTMTTAKVTMIMTMMMVMIEDEMKRLMKDESVDIIRDLYDPKRWCVRHITYGPFGWKERKSRKPMYELGLMLV